MRHSLALSTLFVTLFLIACGEQANNEIVKEVVRPAKIFQVQDSELELIRTFPAEVESHQGSLLAFRVNGELASLDVLAGQDVEQGQLLAKLDPEDFILQLDDRRARFELAKSQFQRFSTLLESKQASQAQFDEAKANMLIAESEFKKAKSNLEYTELRAPFSGSISQLYVENYENVVAKQSILFLQNQELLDVSIQVPERFVARVKKDSGYQPTVIFDSFPDKNYLLTVKEWDTTADPTTLTYKVVFTLPRPENFNLLPGMTGNVKIDLTKVTSVESQGLFVPVAAVFTPADSKLANKERFVWLFNEATGEVNKRQVTVGTIHQQGIEVLTGLNVGDKIVAAGSHYLQEGMKVKPWSRERGL